MINNLINTINIIIQKDVNSTGSVGQIMLELQFGKQPKEHKITEVIISSFYLANIIIYQIFN
jgi:hypothetical protein